MVVPRGVVEVKQKTRNLLRGAPVSSGPKRFKGSQLRRQDGLNLRRGEDERILVQIIPACQVLNSSIKFAGQRHELLNRELCKRTKLSTWTILRVSHFVNLYHFSWNGV
jgi:hypothetical protein